VSHWRQACLSLSVWIIALSIISFSFLCLVLLWIKHLSVFGCVCVTFIYIFIWQQTLRLILSLEYYE
jgi:hypothetical protein